MPYDIEFTRAADKVFSSLPKSIRERTDEALDGLEQDPWPAGHKKLKGAKETFFRIRVGDYRIVYMVEEERLVVVLIRIGHRREVYRNL